MIVTIRFSKRFLCSLSIAASASISASLVDPCFMMIMTMMIMTMMIMTMIIMTMIMLIMMTLIMMMMRIKMKRTSGWMPVTIGPIWLAPTIFKWLYSS